MCIQWGSLRIQGNKRATLYSLKQNETDNVINHTIIKSHENDVIVFQPSNLPLSLLYIPTSQISAQRQVLEQHHQTLL